MEALRLGTVEIDPTTGRVVRPDGRETALTATELKLVQVLDRATGEPVSRTALIHAVWSEAPKDNRAVDTTISRIRRKVEIDASAPRHLLTEHGAGYRLLAERTPAHGPHLVGRQTELARLEDWLHGGVRVVTLTGPPGVGKTAVARELVRTRRAIDWPGGVWFGAATALGTVVVDPDLRSLVVLDGLDAAQTAETASRVRVLVERSPLVHVLSVGRTRLGIRGERLLRLAPLREEDGLRLSLRLQGNPLGGEDADSLLRIVRASRGLPLALEVLLTSDLSARESLSLPAERVFRDVLARMEASWRRLLPEDRRALCSCASLPSPFTLAALEVRLGALAIDRLEVLVDHSLVLKSNEGDTWEVSPFVETFLERKVGH